MDNDLSFGRWVKVRRVALGLTQAQLAERIGYSIVTIRKIESDGTRPSRQLMDKLAEGLALAGEERPDFARRARGERCQSCRYKKETARVSVADGI